MLEVFSHYLPYKLKMKNNLEDSDNPTTGTLIGIDMEGDEYEVEFLTSKPKERYSEYFYDTQMLPKLRSFISLVDPIRVVGGNKPITPVVKLAQLAINLRVDEGSVEVINNNSDEISVRLRANVPGYDTCKYEFYIDDDWNMFLLKENYRLVWEDKPYNCQVEIFRFLLRYHFDIFDLISQGKAVEIKKA